jgi:2-alkyl-3-oxoalkanoate reductase
MKDRVLVLGAGGFIGRRVVNALAASDWASPVAAMRRAVPAGSSVTHVQFDATDGQALRACLKDIRGVVNCVAGSDDTIVRGAEALFSAACAMPEPPHIVHMSSLAVYGEATGEVYESTPPTGTLSGYGAAKIASERASAAAPSVVILRPGIVYGPGSLQWSERIASLLKVHRLGDLGRGGDGFCNLVYIDDTVDAILRCLRRPDLRGKVFNLSLPQPPTWNEYFIRYAKSLGAVPVSRITRRRLAIELKVAFPLKALQLVAQRLGPSALRLIPEPLVPSVARLFTQEIKMNVRAAETDLGMTWTDLRQGLDATAHACLAHANTAR